MSREDWVQFFFFGVLLGVLVSVAVLMRGRVTRALGATLFAIMCIVLLTPVTLAGLGGLGSPVHMLSVFVLPSLVEPNDVVRNAIVFAWESNLLGAAAIAAIAFVFAKTVLFGQLRPRVRNVLVAPLVGAVCYAGVGLSIEAVLASDAEEFTWAAEAHLMLAAATFLALACYAYSLRFRVLSSSRHRVAVDAITILIPIAFFVWISNRDLILILVFSLPFVAGYWAFVRSISVGAKRDSRPDGA